MGEARRRAEAGAPAVQDQEPANEVVSRLLFMPRAMVDDIQRELGYVNQERARKKELPLTWQTFVVYALLPHSIETVQATREAYERSQRSVLLPSEVPREAPTSRIRMKRPQVVMG